MKPALLALSLCLTATTLCMAEPRSVSGIYPSLAMFNREGECGTGAVVPWAGRLWVITYGPHLPFGSTDKLYEITPDLKQIVRPESIGGTPANRMIHRESNQLAIGPYLIDVEGKVRVIPWQKMPGRLTGTARHLSDPANKLYYATMEEALYEVDVHTLEVTGLIRDGNKPKAGATQEDRPAKAASALPGYHGKGLYSGQGRVIYANNGEHSERARRDPRTPSGALGEWQGEGDWKMVRRNQFTEVTGPNGIFGSEKPETDPVWSVGWDARSLILMLLENGRWHTYRLPKSSHSYDGAHGWNTEWPRIRDIGERDLLMTMHGAFWRFPKNFSVKNSSGITPRSNYLKVIGDFAQWQDRLVFGCDDTAKSEFLNKRKAKGELAPPGQSQSNLMFMEPEKLDQLGPVIGRGAVWEKEDVKAGVASDPFLFGGYALRSLFLEHRGEGSLECALEVDERGDNSWRLLRSVTVPAGESVWTEFAAPETGAWIRLTPKGDARQVSAIFAYRNPDRRPAVNASIFEALAKPTSTNVSGGLLLTTGNDSRKLRFLARDAHGELGCYDLDEELRLLPVEGANAAEEMRKSAAVPRNVLGVDRGSVLYVDENGRWRLPKGNAAFDEDGKLGEERICREVCTERDLFNAHGSFYELPAENAGGFAKIRPISTHNLRIKDYASFRGLVVLSGLEGDAGVGEHVVRSADGKAALWVGCVEDLWQLGKARGRGGPWRDSEVKAGVPSDPYLMNGYDKKSFTLSHSGTGAMKFRVEVDPSGEGSWVRYGEFEVKAGATLEHRFPDAFSAAWVRVVGDKDTTATAEFVYE